MGKEERRRGGRGDGEVNRLGGSVSEKDTGYARNNHEFLEMT